ncbi:hypothetical protein G6321_00017145 [Bradyrhizobium barranii subsp. barranii]|uniref:Uncharacterized protein n=1 Tax=Bradyrhizobium barranii subsp. barranii TaxID=2823807 RepID=A0A7Z0Q4Z2_9BRAD|nr:hypothetical protein [Bradyrhizobium barranii]UGX96769.1 hypothetical protein G6321_00017145 [Bradyrhizobium barranii subsp. barranii]
MSYRGHVSKGSFIIAHGGPVSGGKANLEIRKGQFITVDCVPNQRPPPVPKDLEQIEGAVEAAGPNYGPAFEKELAAIMELTRRLELVKAQLSSSKAKRK